MKKFGVKIIFTIIFTLFSISKVNAVQFDVLVLPTDIFNVCDNYFCFPEPSEIAAKYVIEDLKAYKTINAIELADIRAKLESKPELKQVTQDMLKNFEQTEKIDFQILNELSKEFGVKSTIIISSYAITDRSATRRDLWEVLEVSSAFKITYPFNLTTTAVLTDNVNSVVMWSNKYNKTVSDSNGYFLALNHAQAASHLEKINQYYRNNVSKNISQNVHLRFFPKDVKTFTVKNQQTEEQEKPSFVPNALEHLIKPQMIKELEEGYSNSSSTDDFIFEF
jgi:phage anti-repressor protein